MRKIGFNIEQPKKECKDKHCPFHSPVSLRGRILVGKVLKMNIHKTITIQIPRQNFLHKYERYEKRESRLKVHKPDCIDVKEGDFVKVAESKPISKTKNFIVIEVLK
ncbi:MAG: 30S ribosomal protein S17 [Candidatus Nanoarchaeia archaeon]|nr:30S ribosomal protein S17 [Candidatus Nanoarchaeia archaeon]